MKKEQEVRERIAQLPGADLVGYMPLREDFDVEYENDAEQVRRYNIHIYTYTYTYIVICNYCIYMLDISRYGVL